MTTTCILLEMYFCLIVTFRNGFFLFLSSCHGRQFNMNFIAAINARHLHKAICSVLEKRNVFNWSVHDSCLKKKRDVLEFRSGQNLQIYSGSDRNPQNSGRVVRHQQACYCAMRIIYVYVVLVTCVTSEYLMSKY